MRGNALVLTLLFAALPASAAENDFSGRYQINIQLKQFGSEDLSMGNASMISPATLVVNGGEAHIEINMQPLTYLGKEGYLASLKKVTKVIEKTNTTIPPRSKLRMRRFLKSLPVCMIFTTAPTANISTITLPANGTPRPYLCLFLSTQTEMLSQVMISLFRYMCRSWKVS